MNVNLLLRAKDAARRLVPFLCVMATVLTVCWVSMGRASALYILTGEDDTAIVLDENANVEDFSSQLVYIGSKASGFELTLTAGQNVTVLYNGASIATVSRQETISELLGRIRATPSPLEMVAVDIKATGVTLTVASDLTYYERMTEQDLHQTVYLDDPSLELGTEKVVQAGVDGVHSVVYEVTYSGGKLVSRHLVSEEDSTAVDEIIHVGTAKEAAAAYSASDKVVNVAKNADGSGTLTLASGATVPFQSAKDMTATAYTKGYGGADSYTATGTTVRMGVVAVDKRVIPLGSKVYVVTNDGRVTYGLAVAEDTGVRGNVIDLYYDTYQQCIQFGRRSATVYVVS